MLQYRGVSLPPERPEHDAERLRPSRPVHHIPPNPSHLAVRVLLPGENPLVRIVPKRRHRWVRNHDGLKVEPSIRDEDYGVLLLLQHRRRAPQHLTGRQGLGLRDLQAREPRLCQGLANLLHCRCKLNGSRERDVRASLEVVLHALDQVCDVEFDVHEDVEARQAGDIHRNETRVPIVHEEIATQRGGGVVVDAARAVRHVAEDYHVFDGVHEGLKYVGQGRGVQKQALRELQREGPDLRLPEPPHTLLHFEAVVRREHGDGGRQLRVVHDVLRHLVADEPFRRDRRGFRGAHLR
mmetsp:Transcript_6085/g.24876  ORF Transcript_6085/g.24876 Transcript_6085/m.24876 type:complete len:295 (-) Transcript_6085:37-921(-)